MNWPSGTDHLENQNNCAHYPDAGSCLYNSEKVTGTTTVTLNSLEFLHGIIYVAGIESLTDQNCVAI